MDIDDRGDRVVLTLSRPEFVPFAGAMNEAIEAVEDWEFETRVGVEKSVAFRMLSELRSARAKKASSE